MDREREMLLLQAQLKRIPDCYPNLTFALKALAGIAELRRAEEQYCTAVKRRTFCKRQAGRL
jgi:hypothetical protein